MRPVLPEKLGFEFWFSLFMIGLCFGLGIWGIALGSGYQASVGGFLGLLYVYGLVKRVREVRLARRLKADPELARLYYARKH
jgi:membrane associated rhomboid family serine protease